MTRTKEQQRNADKLADDVAAFLARGGEIQQMPDDMSGDRYLIQIDKGLKNVSPTRSGKARKYQFNGSM